MSEQSIALNHQLHQEIFSTKHKIPVFTGDFLNPSGNTIISHDGQNVVSLYSEMVWDLNSYSLTHNAEPFLRFLRYLSIDGEPNKFEVDLINQVKTIMLAVIYKARGGRFGRISVKGLRRHYYLLMEMARFCLEVKKRESLVTLKVFDVLSNERWLLSFYKTVPESKSRYDLLNSIARISSTQLGFTTVRFSHRINLTGKDNQHPVIPVSIYLRMVNGLEIDLAYLHHRKNKITNLIKMFKDPNAGYSVATIKGNKLVPEYLIKESRLKDLFTNKYTFIKKRDLINTLYKIQYVCHNIIALYTGMRTSEVMDIKYDCIQQKTLSPKLFDEGNTLLEPEVIDLVSCTTKYTGCNQEASWFANSSVKMAVEVLQAINSGLSHATGKDFSNILFINPQHIYGKSHLQTVFKRKHQPDWYRELLITQTDMDLLRASNEDHTFGDKFMVGKAWYLTPHQFRRSLAYYAANSGFVSLPTLTVQFKHLVSSITKYYCRNSESVKSIFGYFNPETKTYELDESIHISASFKEEKLAVVINTLIEDVLNSDEVLYGKSGNYIQRQRLRVESPDEDMDTIVLGLRKETLKAVKDGEISYRGTLLGGCIKAEGCACRMLGEFSSCLSSACAIIKPKKVDEQIDELSGYINQFDKSSGEYQVVKDELDALMSFRDKESRKNDAT
ncbi:Site-specific recombinase, phage integrase family [Moritella viscosa]|uniref:hypothetical protein n=1 Tax=Moritella viscosa TaxID=80854 RepID=UPI00050920C4|nr:hypothetical protein [Moritella viscosa]CED61464.1 putative phage integrase [Moritella viscosa]SHO05449.1 Site-specific recombinase, phage integrase family [Moritella viscosa]SHO21423.1 Site-specific recombinase, phage integrase family [Moritella viscosa]